MPSRWPLNVLIVALPLAACVVFLYRIGVRGRAEAERFRRLPASPDEVYLRACGIEPNSPAARVAMEVRRILGEMSGVPAGSIRAEDRFRVELSRLPPWDSPDDLGFLLSLEAGLNVKITSDRAEGIGDVINSPAGSVRDLVHVVVRIATPVETP